MVRNLLTRFFAGVSNLLSESIDGVETSVLRKRKENEKVKVKEIEKEKEKRRHWLWLIVVFWVCPHGICWLLLYEDLNKVIMRRVQGREKNWIID